MLFRHFRRFLWRKHHQKKIKSLTSRGVTKKYANFNREPDILDPFGTAWYLSHMHSIKNNRNFYFLPQKRKEINLLFVFFLVSKICSNGKFTWGFIRIVVQVLKISMLVSYNDFGAIWFSEWSIWDMKEIWNPIWRPIWMDFAHRSEAYNSS